MAKSTKSTNTRFFTHGIQTRPANMSSLDKGAGAYGRSISVAQARNVPVNPDDAADKGRLVIGLHNTVTGYQGGQNVNAIPSGHIILDLESAKQFVTAIQERIALEERAVELEEPKFIDVTVRVPVKRASHPQHAKNLVQRAVDEYYSENGEIDAQVVGEARIVTGKDAD